MKDLGALRRYLGVDFVSTDQGVLMHQAEYSSHLISEYKLHNSRPAKTPLPEGLTLSAETNTQAIDPTTYCQLVGKLIYLTNTRPNLSFAVGLVSRFMSQPQQAHWDAAIHILKYISGTMDLGIFFQRSPHLELQGYTDSDWGNSCSDTRRSTGGHIFMLASGPITWSSKRQPTVSRSTTEAEYRSLSDGAQEGVYLKRLIEELHRCHLPPAQIKCKDATIATDLGKALSPTQQDLHLMCDNISAIKLAKNPVFHARTKHLEIHHHFVRERQLAGEISVQHISTQEQPADILTKSLSRIKFEQHRKSIGMRSASDASIFSSGLL